MDDKVEIRIVEEDMGCWSNTYLNLNNLPVNQKIIIWRDENDQIWTQAYNEKEESK